MGDFRDPALVQQGFRIAMGDEFDPRESIQLVWGPSRDPRTRQAALEFVDQNFDAIVARMPRDYGAGLVAIGSGFCDDSHAHALEKSFRPRARAFPGGDRRYPQPVEVITLCAAFPNNAGPEPAAWVEQRTLEAHLHAVLRSQY